MEKQKITGSEALLKSLIAEGVDTIFGYPGGQAIPIYDSLYDYRDKLKHVLVRHEQGATHAAQGYARVSGKVGVTLVTSGPGATNTITGIADALMDSTPMVVIAGQVPSPLLGTDAFQEVDVIGITHQMGVPDSQAGRDSVGCFTCFLYRFYRTAGACCTRFGKGCSGWICGL